MDLNQTRDQMEMFGFTAEGAQQEADKFVEEAGDLETDISNAASFLVPFYDSGVNISNVVQEYRKPEQERDYEYIKDQFKEAGQSAAIEGGLLLMGGVAGKYGAKGIKALADKVKQYEINPNVMSAFGAGAIRKKPTIKEGVPTIEAAGLTDEAIETWRKKNKTSDEFRKSLKGRNPELQELAKGVSEGRVFSSTYRKRADELRPIRIVKEVPKPATNKEIVSALNDKQRRNPIIGLNEKVSTGEMVNVRLNIPAYTDYDVWVPTIRHNGKEKYKAAVRIKNVNFIKPTLSDGAKRTDSSKALKVAEGGEKNPFAVMTGEYVEGTDDELFTMAKEVFDSDEWTQVGYDPIKRGFFYDRETGQAILEADEVIQVGHLVLAKNAKKTDPDVFPFNKGGAVMDDQMEMAFMNEGGIADDGMDVDPVSGNEVPPGSLAEEVRDDIPAQLSEGEYVVPADVVRYYGVKFFEDLRDEAKRGLAEMEANGRIGGEPVPAGGPINDQELSPQEMQAIQEMMGMAEGGEVQNPYLQQQQLYSQPRPAPIDEKRNTTITNVNPVENQMPMQSMASGGQVQGYQDSGDVMKDAPSFVQNQFNPAQYGLGYSFMGQQPQQTGTTGTTTTQAPQGQTFTVLYHPDYATNGRSKTFYLPRDNEIYQQYLDMGYTKQMPMTGPAGQGETTPTTDTTGTTGTTGTGTTGGSGGSGTTVTTGGGTGKGFSFGFKNWGEDVDWTSSDAIMKFVEESQKGLIDAKTGNRLTAIGAAAGPLGAVAGATAGNLPTLQSVSDLRAAAIIARAQGLDETAASIDQQVQDILKQSSGITRFVDKFFNETVDGDAKGKAGLDRLGFEYTVDKKTGNPIFSAEQIASNKAKSSKPKPEPIISTRVAKPGVRSGVQTAKAVRGGRGTVTEKPGARQEAARKAAKKRSDKRKSAIRSVREKENFNPTKERKETGGGDRGLNKGGLMNKKGKKK